MELAGNSFRQQRCITMRVVTGLNLILDEFSVSTYQFPLPRAGEGEGEGKTRAAPPSPQILSLQRGCVAMAKIGRRPHVCHFERSEKSKIPHIRSG